MGTAKEKNGTVLQVPIYKRGKTGISAVEPGQGVETGRLLLRPLMVAPEAAVNTKVFEDSPNG